MHIVIVDDDPGILEVLERYLSGPDIRVTAVRRAAMARSVLFRDHVSLLLADARLPGESGIELTRSASEFGIPVLIMTGDVAWAMSQGVAPEQLLCKPFDLSAAKRRILQALAA